MSLRQEFLKYMASEEASPSTIVSYRGVLGAFEPLAEILDIDPPGLVDQIERVAGRRKWGASTRAKALFVLRSFYRWGEFRGHCTTNPAATIRPPRTETKLKSVPDKHSIGIAWNLMRGTRPWSETSPTLVMPAAAVGLLYFTALRRGEALGLRWEDVDLPAATITVRRSAPKESRPKGRKDRKVPIAAELLEILTALHSRLGGRGYVLGGTRPLTRDDLAGWVKGFARRLTVKVTPHGLRHARATHLAEAGIQPVALQQFLGHATIGSTMGYVHASARFVTEELTRVGG